jgi:diacylglycerol kinase family enzyme
VQAEESEVTEPVEERVREVSGLLPLVDERGDLGLDEAADAGTEGIVLGGGDGAAHRAAG